MSWDLGKLTTTKRAFFAATSNNLRPLPLILQQFISIFSVDLMIECVPLLILLPQVWSDSEMTGTADTPKRTDNTNTKIQKYKNTQMQKIEIINSQKEVQIKHTCNKHEFYVIPLREGCLLKDMHAIRSLGEVQL